MGANNSHVGSYDAFNLLIAPSVGACRIREMALEVLCGMGLRILSVTLYFYLHNSQCGRPYIYTKGVGNLCGDWCVSEGYTVVGANTVAEASTLVGADSKIMIISSMRQPSLLKRIHVSPCRYLEPTH